MILQSTVTINPKKNNIPFSYRVYPFRSQKVCSNVNVRCTKDNYVERSSLELNLTIIIMAMVQNFHNMERAHDGSNKKVGYP